MVLTVPPIEKDRYFSIQLIDAYTFNFDYIGSRTTGNDGGSFLVAGPGWKGETPKGIDEGHPLRDRVRLAVYRTQLFNPADLDEREEDTGRLQGAAAVGVPRHSPRPRPRRRSTSSSRSRPRAQKTSPEFFNILNFVLKFCPDGPVREGPDGALRQDRRRRRARRFDAGELSPELKAAIEEGMADAWAEFADFKKRASTPGR